MESRAISDAQISASSEWNSYFPAFRGRLNLRYVKDDLGRTWMAKYRDKNQWLQADLGSSRNITQ